MSKPEVTPNDLRQLIHWMIYTEPYQPPEVVGPARERIAELLKQWDSQDNDE